MEAADNLGQARHSRDPAKIAQAQKAFNALQAEIAARATAGPTRSAAQ
jgi:hypothetical protein